MIGASNMKELKLMIGTLEQCVKSAQSKQQETKTASVTDFIQCALVSIVDFKRVSIFDFKMIRNPAKRFISFQPVFTGWEHMKRFAGFRIIFTI